LKCAVHETFAQDVFSGLTQADAYRKSFPKSRKWTAGTLWKEACILAGKESVRDRIEYLKSQVASRKIATKEELAEIMTNIARPTIADFIEVDANGEQFVRVTKSTLACHALKKVKVKRITDQQGNTVMGIHLTELELESKVAAAKALADLMGYDAPKKHEVSADEGTREFLARVLGAGLNNADD